MCFTACARSSYFVKGIDRPSSDINKITRIQWISPLARRVSPRPDGVATRTPSSSYPSTCREYTPSPRWGASSLSAFVPDEFRNNSYRYFTKVLCYIESWISLTGESYDFQTGRSRGNGSSKGSRDQAAVVPQDSVLAQLRHVSRGEKNRIIFKKILYL